MSASSAHASSAHEPSAPLRVLVVTGGHPFERTPFRDVFASFEEIASRDIASGDIASGDRASGHHDTSGLEVEYIEQPAALDRIRPGLIAADVVVFYDMPGLQFTRSDPPVEFSDPPTGFIEGLRELLSSGVGMVFMHHAIASWPTSNEFAELVGGRFHYQPGVLGGIAYPDSGYVFDVAHTVEVLDRDHPICAGVPPHFEITDELYQFPVLESVVTPLMRTTHDMSGSGFFSADAAIRGRRNDAVGWAHPPGSALVAWTCEQQGGRLAYIQFGDGPQTYADPTYRRILHNAITWTAG